MDTFSTHDLHDHAAAVIRDAEEGKLSLVTEEGHAVFLAVPFSTQLLEVGLHKSLAINLFKENVLTLEQAAKLAQQPIESFIETLSTLNIPIVTYSAAELAKELEAFEESTNPKATPTRRAISPHEPQNKEKQVEPKTIQNTRSK